MVQSRESRLVAVNNRFMCWNKHNRSRPSFAFSTLAVNCKCPSTPIWETQSALRSMTEATFTWADRHWNAVIRIPSTTFDPSNFGPGLFPGGWAQIYAPDGEPFPGIVIDVSVDSNFRVHITFTCNCYAVYDGVSGNLWSVNGTGGGHLQHLRGVDAKSLMEVKTPGGSTL